MVADIALPLRAHTPGVHRDNRRRAVAEVVYAGPRVGEPASATQSL